jgi:hypothetical protein
MTSLQTSIRQVPVDCGNFVTVANMVTGTYTSSVKLFYPDNSNAGTGSFSNAAWACSGLPSSILNVAGGVLRDMGRTIISSGKTFRKVQLVLPGNNENNANQALRTFGVGGSADSSDANGNDLSGYYTGYIQLGLGGSGAAPVARV